MNWKTTAASLVLGGLAGAESVAGPLDTNLVDNPSFEDTSVWVSNGGTISSYAYSQAYTSAAVPPSPGERYFTGKASASTTTTQTIDLVAKGFSAAELDTGATAYSLSAFFSTYLQQNDNTAITARFLSSPGGSELGVSATIGGLDFVSALGSSPNINGAANYRDWGSHAAASVLPVGTRAVELVMTTTRLAGNAADGYTDLVDFRVTAVPEPSTLGLAALGGFGLGMGAFRRRRRSR